MKQRKIGNSGICVGEIGLGCMGMSPEFYGPSDDDASLATLEHAYRRGVTLYDTISIPVPAVSFCT